MSLQAIKYQSDINLLPDVKNAIESAEEPQSSKMYGITIDRIRKSKYSLSNISERNRQTFSDSLIEFFKAFGWI